MKRFLLFSILIFSVLSLYSNEKTILKVFELPDPKKTDPFTKADRAVIEAFKEKYPDIELRSFSGIEIENMSLDSAPLMAIAGGVSPDILYVNFRQSSTYIENGFLYPMDEFVKNYSQEQLNYRVAKPVWPVINRKNENGEQHIWCLPYETLVRVMMYAETFFIKLD